jgi:iron(III) transport system substrate-binding protein
MIRTLLLVGALAVIVGAPFALKPKENLILKADRTLVIITPHNEAIRSEFAIAFRRYYLAKHGQTVRLDWRVIGGTSEIARYLSSEYETAFANYWTNQLHRRWDQTVRDSYANPKIVPGPDPANDTPAEAARRAFLESNVGIGMDLFFGGGSYDFQQQAMAGRLVDSGVLQRHPEWFGEKAIPKQLGGEPLWDSKGLWVGTVLAGYGILSNLDLLARLGVKEPPSQWSELGDPVYRHQLALADPTKSGAAAKAYEMVVQQQMQQRLDTLEASEPGAGAAEADARELRARDEGWIDAMRLFIRLGGNTRYFSDGSQKPPIDVGDGDAAVAMGIDFYGRQMAGATEEAAGRGRVVFISPVGGTSFGTDPIGLLRGAPEAELSKDFIDFVLSLEGQKLWNFRPGTPGGPEKFSLRRLPIRPELYGSDNLGFVADPGVNPFEEGRQFSYRAAWTERLFRSLSFIVRVMCQDPHDELKEAWAEIARANFPPEAMDVLLDVSAVDYAAADGRIRQALGASNKIEEVRLAKDLSSHFRDQYRRAAALARGAK